MTSPRVHLVTWSILTVIAGTWAALACAQPAVDGLTPYRATYALFNGDDRVGESSFSLQYDIERNRYVFETRSSFRGLLRLAAPGPIVERSEFIVTDGAIRPLRFTYEDGSRRGKRDVELEFDWQAGRLIVDSASRRELDLPPSGLDRASARVALMLALSNAVARGSQQIADPDEFRRYDFRSGATETLTTALGEVEAVRVVQQRPGSTRRTVTWAAPALDFLPVRIEQHRDDRDPIAFVIEDIDWLERSGGRAPAR